ncbi:MAG: hypothetical protein V3T17_05660 [Pseudomonadales bacterium]
MIKWDDYPKDKDAGIPAAPPAVLIDAPQTAMVSETTNDQKPVENQTRVLTEGYQAETVTESPNNQGVSATQAPAADSTDDTQTTGMTENLVEGAEKQLRMRLAKHKLQPQIRLTTHRQQG